MRIVAAIFVGVHGLGHIIWFMSTWTQRALGRGGRDELEAHRYHFLVDSVGATGKALGILSLFVLVGFVASGRGIWIQASWWPPLLIGSAVASMPSYSACGTL